MKRSRPYQEIYNERTFGLNGQFKSNDNNSFESVELGIEIFIHIYYVLNNVISLHLGEKIMIFFHSPAKQNNSLNCIQWILDRFIEGFCSHAWSLWITQLPHAYCEYDWSQTHHITIVKGLNLHLQIAHQFDSGILNLWVFLHFFDDARDLINWERWIFCKNLWTENVVKHFVFFRGKIIY